MFEIVLWIVGFFAVVALGAAALVAIGLVIGGVMCRFVDWLERLGL